MVFPPQSYVARRAHLASLAMGPDREPAEIAYLPREDWTWSTVASALDPLWDQHVCVEVLEARRRLQLPGDRVPQLAEVNAALLPMTGVRFAAVDGILPASEFFEFLERSMFPSTQYLRWDGAPLYTPEPDILHEVLGHGSMLASPQLAELHRLAGNAVGRVASPEAVQRLADVFWYTVEFGVVRENDGWRAYGAGLLSSPGELAQFAAHATVLPLDIDAMCTRPYEIHEYQPVLFGAESIDQVLDVVGGFFESV